MGSYVRVVNDKKVVEPRRVKLGVQDGNDRVVLEGLNGDEWVVVTGLLRAIPGKQVTPERSGAQPGAEGAKTPGPNPESRKKAAP